MTRRVRISLVLLLTALAGVSPAGARVWSPHRSERHATHKRPRHRHHPRPHPTIHRATQPSEFATTTTLTCPDPAAEGVPLSVTGAVTAGPSPLADHPVQVVFWAPNAPGPETQDVWTNSQGAFAATVSSPHQHESGTWEVTASFAGDTVYSASGGGCAAHVRRLASSMSITCPAGTVAAGAPFDIMGTVSPAMGQNVSVSFQSPSGLTTTDPVPVQSDGGLTDQTAAAPASGGGGTWSVTASWGDSIHELVMASCQLHVQFDAPQVGDIGYQSCLGGHVGPPDCGAAPFDEVRALAVSPDGKQLYVVGNGRLDVLARDATNQTLTPVACFGPAPCTTVPAGALPDPRGPVSQQGYRDAEQMSIAISSDGSTLAVGGSTWADTGSAFGSVAVFSRATDGSLTFRSCVANDTSSGCAAGSSPLFGNIRTVTVNADGSRIFAGGDALVELANNANGSLSLVDCVSASVSGCLTPPLGSNSVYAEGLTLTPTGNSLIVANASNVTAWSIDSSTGQFSYSFCAGPSGYGNSCAVVTPSTPNPAGQNFSSVAYDATRNQLYTITGHMLEIINLGGFQPAVTCIDSGEGVASCTHIADTALNQADFLAISPDGSNVYVGGEEHSTYDSDVFPGDIAAFRVESDNSLTWLNCVGDGYAGCSNADQGSFSGMTSLVVSPDDSDVYVGSWAAGSVVTLKRYTGP
jgi:hypothetical protein